MSQLCATTFAGDDACVLVLFGQGATHYRPPGSPHAPKLLVAANLRPGRVVPERSGSDMRSAVGLLSIQITLVHADVEQDPDSSFRQGARGGPVGPIPTAYEVKFSAAQETGRYADLGRLCSNIQSN